MLWVFFVWHRGAVQCAGPPGTNYQVMKRAFEEGWGGVIAKTVSLDSSKVRHALQASPVTSCLAKQSLGPQSHEQRSGHEWQLMSAFGACCQDCKLHAEQWRCRGQFRRSGLRQVVNVTPRYAKLKGRADTREVIGWENIELISDRPFNTMLEEFKRLKQEFPGRILIASIMEARQIVKMNCCHLHACSARILVNDAGRLHEKPAI